MKKLLTVLSVVILACTSCIMQVGNGKTVHCTGPIFNQNYDSLGVFNAVVVNGNSDLHITQAETCGVNVTANEEVFQYLNYRIEDGVLIITTKDHVNIRAEKYDVYVRAPFLTKIGVNGAADVDQCPSITARFRIRNVPTVLFFKNGELKDKSVGAVQKKTLTDKIDALL